MRADADFVRLQTDRLLLRRSTPQDAETISAYRSDPEVHVHQGWDRTDAEGVRDEIVEMANRAPGQAGGWVQLSAEERSTGALVGDVGLSAVADEPGAVKIGYTIAPAYQGRGYGTEAVAALVAYAFDVLGAETVFAHADADNVRSIRVMEKVGMRFVRRFEGHDANGSWFAVRYERHAT